MNDHLQHAVFVADIEEHHAAVVADVLDPARYAHLLSDVFFSELTAADSAVNIFFYHLKLSFHVLFYPFYGIITHLKRSINIFFRAY